MANRKMKNNAFLKYLTSPKGYVICVLLILTFIAGLNFQSQQGLINAVISVAAAVFLDTLIAVGQERKRIFPDGAAITGLIVALVLSASVAWSVVVATSMIATISKHIFVINRKPIFNPAAFGLFVSILLFSSEQDWWGGLSLLPVWYIFFVIAGGFIITQRVNKLPQTFAFLAVYFLLFLLMGMRNPAEVSDVFRIPFVNSTVFLAFFMVTDPPTSPSPYKDQLLFGSLAAVVSVGINLTVGGLSFLLVGLLAANIWNARKVWKAAK